ncbi:very short patch repair endonuclease [Agromyces sp. MMS24-JH15]|uniref:very short patch repair endonuclease n=1 Tax=Agromyces sp. MMS24-JH15 TaxID=3243765 RepID=UPI003747A789
MAEPRESWATSEGTRKSMLANKRRDTTTELAVRTLLHARGLRYRVDYAPVPGLRRRADIVFTRARTAVFIDGCFWHGCPEHATHPKRNADYWGPKLAANVERDRDTDRRLEEAGWRVLRYWEHEAAADVAASIGRELARERG